MRPTTPHCLRHHVRRPRLSEQLSSSDIYRRAREEVAVVQDPTCSSTFCHRHAHRSQDDSARDVPRLRAVSLRMRWNSERTAHTAGRLAQAKPRENEKTPRDALKLLAPRCAARCRHNLKPHLDESRFFLCVRRPMPNVEWRWAEPCGRPCSCCKLRATARRNERLLLVLEPAFQVHSQTTRPKEKGK